MDAALSPGEQAATAAIAPLASFLLAVRNGASSLPAAIVSIQSQTISNFEAIIIDDASTDATWGILDRAAQVDKRLRIVRNPMNRGLAACLNDAAQMARSEYLVRIDADDMCLPHRLAVQLKIMHSHPSIMVLGGAALDARTGQRLCPPPSWRILRRRVPFITPVIHPTVMMRRSWLFRVGGYNAKLRRAQDSDLWFRTISADRIANCPVPVITYDTPPAHGRPNDYRWWTIVLYRHARRTGSYWHLLSIVTRVIIPMVRRYVGGGAR